MTMLQILLYHSASMEETSSSDQNEAALLELVDYVHRKLVSIVAGKVSVEHFNAHLVEQDTAKVCHCFICIGDKFRLFIDRNYVCSASIWSLRFAAAASPSSVSSPSTCPKPLSL